MANKKRSTTRSTKQTTATAGSSNGSKLTIKVPAPVSRETAPEEDHSFDTQVQQASTPLSDPLRTPESVDGIKHEPETSQLDLLDQPVTLDMIELTDSRSISPDIQFVNHTPSSFVGKRTRSDVEDHADGKPLPKKPKPDEAVGFTMHKETCDLANDEELEEEQPRKFTVYVQVYQTVIEKKLGRGGKIASTTTYVSKEPFRFNTLQSFAKFKMEVSSVLSCNFGALPVLKFEWKFEGQPQSAPRKKIADQVGFEALLDAIKVKCTTDNVVVWLYTPKPPKDEDEWDDDHVQRRTEIYDDGACPGDGPSGSKALISGMMAKRNDAEAKLMREYPVGNFEIFPDKRVWKSKPTGSYFELTPLQIKFWANAIAGGLVDVSAPPNSQHFSEDKHMKVPNPTAPQNPGAFLTPPAANGPIEYYPQAALPPMGHAPPPLAPYGYPPYYPPPYGHGPFVPGAVPYPYHQPAGARFPYRPPTSSPSTTSHNVSLSDFCAQYSISESNARKLAALEYRPGHRGVKRLEEKEWREHGKFTKLGWEAFLEAHYNFCDAIKSRQM